jgi:hypothetical protein
MLAVLVVFGVGFAGLFVLGMRWTRPRNVHPTLRRADAANTEMPGTDEQFDRISGAVVQSWPPSGV